MKNGVRNMARKKERKKSEIKKEEKEHKSFKIILAVLLIIAMISLIEGFGPTFSHMIIHLQQDLQEWAIHLYIFGWILVIYGFYRLNKRN